MFTYVIRLVNWDLHFIWNFLLDGIRHYVDKKKLIRDLFTAMARYPTNL